MLQFILCVVCFLFQITYASKDNVESSNFFRNFRHTVNTLTIYKRLVGNGVPKQNIVLLIAGDMQCNARNYYYGEIRTKHFACDLMKNTTIAFRNDDVSLATFIGVLLDELPPTVSSTRRLHSSQDSTVLLFLNGHGGDDFFKFREKEELNSQILFNALSRMFMKGRYRDILVIIDTCQASTLIPKVIPPHSLFLASSSKGEESYSKGFDANFGLPTEDRFITLLMQFMIECENNTMSDLSILLDRFLNFKQLQSTVGWKSIKLTTSICSFFGF